MMWNSSTSSGRCASKFLRLWCNTVLCPTSESSRLRGWTLIGGDTIQVALLSPFVQREVLRSGHGVSGDDPVVLPKQVCAAVQLCCTFLACCEGTSGMTMEVQHP